MREINQIVIHCSATSPDMNIGAEEIRGWHKEKGWSDIGYHYVIRRSGTREKGRPVENPGAHVKGHNENSIGICLVGGRDIVDYTTRQWDSLKFLVDYLTYDYGIPEVLGHRDFPGVDKECPRFDVRAWWGRRQ